MTKSFASLCVALVGLAATIAPAIAVEERAPPCECQPGYYHRRADAEDMRCVTAKLRQRIRLENNSAAGNTGPDGYCLSGYVFRDAFNGDGVCVLPSSRDRVHAENANGMQYADPLCSLGLYNSNTNPNDD